MESTESINVFLQYPWKFPDSSYYKNIVEYPPNNVNYVNYGKKSKKFKVIGSSKKFQRFKVLKNVIRKFLSIFKIPNLTFTFNRESEITHCAHCLSLNKKPWVVDTEVFDRIAASGNIAYSKIGKFIIKRRLESDYCKRIICWSKDCKKTFEEVFPGNKKILGKISILPFAFSKPKFKKKRHKNIRILFIARWFDAKGGRQTLEIFDRLTKKHSNVECWFICPTPKGLRRKYIKNSKIKIMDLMPQEELFKEIYPSCDIFFYPGFGDSYGFAVPEAMSFGLPIISTNTFAKEEIVGNSGFLIDLPKDWKGYQDMSEEFLKNLEEKTELLIKNRKLREKMSEIALIEAKERFSIEKRNKELERIYEESLA